MIIAVLVHQCVWVKNFILVQGGPYYYLLPFCLVLRVRAITNVIQQQG